MSSRMAVLALCFIGCQFSAQPAQIGDASPPDARVDSRPPVTCGDLAEGGNHPGSSFQADSTNQRATIHGGGFCGWYGPTDTPNNPFNDNVTDGKLLLLAYQP
jgi:hypothetical protein